MQPEVPMPPNVAKAVVEVMSKVKRLQKDAENSHGKYRFAGIDAFLEECRPLCAEAGLIIVQDEEHFEVVDGKWLMIRYAFTLAHQSGETWGNVIRRTIMVQAAMGSQAFGAAQSYVEKQFMRSLFQIATGENEDVDTHQAAPLPAARSDFPPPAKPKQTLKERADAFAASIRAAATKPALERVWKLGEGLRNDLDRGEPELLVEVSEAYTAQLDNIETRAKEAA